MELIESEARARRSAFYKTLIELGKKRLAQEAERKKKMETVKLTIGSVQSSSSGTATLDTTQDVEFEGERLAEYSEPGTGRDGNPTDTRGTTETLYRASDGRLVVHVKDWSHWQGEPTTWHLYQVTEADLAGTGRFARLGSEAGYGRPLTLDEALGRSEYGQSEPRGQILREGDAILDPRADIPAISTCALCLRQSEYTDAWAHASIWGADVRNGLYCVCPSCMGQLLRYYDPTCAEPSEGDAPRCADCGKPLPKSTSPYYTSGDSPGVYLCDDCAEPGEV